MARLIATCAAAAVTALLALPAPANAAPRQATGLKQSDQIEVSAARRPHHRGPVRLAVRPWCGPYGRYCEAYRRGRLYNAPYAAYAYARFYEKRPYYTPGPPVGFAPFDTGPYGFGSNLY
jgi:hypothetical protein